MSETRRLGAHNSGNVTRMTWQRRYGSETLGLHPEVMIVNPYLHPKVMMGVPSGSIIGGDSQGNGSNSFDFILFWKASNSLSTFKALLKEVKATCLC